MAFMIQLVPIFHPFHAHPFQLFLFFSLLTMYLIAPLLFSSESPPILCPFPFFRKIFLDKVQASEPSLSIAILASFFDKSTPPFSSLAKELFQSYVTHLCHFSWGHSCICSNFLHTRIRMNAGREKSKSSRSKCTFHKVPLHLS